MKPIKRCKGNETVKFQTIRDCSLMIGEKAADLIKGKDTIGEFRQKIASLEL
jgi:hypothetical protein